MCAIVGVINSNEAAKISYYALFAMQHRGQEATGISACDNDKIKTIKDRGLVTKVFNDNSFEVLKGSLAVGHNRYSTAGNDSILDAQPIYARYSLGEISIVHNGNLINKNEVRAKLIEDGAIFQSSMDTENVVHLIARSKKEHLKDRIIEALHVIKGAYCFIILSRHKMFVIRDRYGVRPLSIGRLRDGGYIAASETCAFDLVGAEFIRDVKPGEMIIFERGKEEYVSEQLFDTDPRICAFEYIYFSRPDSVIEGKNVYETRKRMGEFLAVEAPVKDVDYVIPVPDSGVAAALGYAAKSGIPFENGIVRNHYVGRTFIEPTQEMRSQKVKLKLSPIAALLNGKKIVVIDDSIVRGTTSKQIVSILKHAGAKEVHMRIASPAIKHPCRYGIDTPSYQELISANLSEDEVRDYIGADSLKFLSKDSLIKSIGDERKYSLVSFDGNYFIQ
ncbi:MAG: amidophosphoribosyltransferase [Campylobacteraceae bacterium]|jgi:amidophosphoribosyltransferase|nr:amidophosphoribosyltransferase [Campylobacteraceae bacterium]